MAASTYDYSPPRETEQEDGKDEGSLGCTACFKEVFKQIEKQTSRKQKKQPLKWFCWGMRERTVVRWQNPTLKHFTE